MTSFGEKQHSLHIILKSVDDTQGWLNARAGWTTQGSRTLHDNLNLTPDPVPRHVATISAARAHTGIHIGGLTHSPRNQSKSLRSPKL
jgi:hypothetical protein